MIAKIIIMIYNIGMGLLMMWSNYSYFPLNNNLGNNIFAHFLYRGCPESNKSFLSPSSVKTSNEISKDSDEPESTGRYNYNNNNNGNTGDTLSISSLKRYASKSSLVSTMDYVKDRVSNVVMPPIKKGSDVTKLRIVVAFMFICIVFFITAAHVAYYRHIGEVSCYTLWDEKDGIIVRIIPKFTIQDSSLTKGILQYLINYFFLNYEICV